MRMEFTKHIAHQTRALTEGLVRRHAQLIHIIEDTAVHRLQAIAHIGQGTVDDHRHRVGDEALLHLLFKFDRDQTILNITHGFSLSYRSRSVTML